jgi:hypothetical protein
VQDLQKEDKEEGMNLDFVPSFLPSFLLACFVVVAHSSNVTNFFGRSIT